MPSGFSLHESAHAVGFWVGGVRVIALEAEAGRGGLCTPAAYHPIAPPDAVVALLAGPLAAARYGTDGEGHELSAGDRGVLARHCQQLLEDTGEHFGRRAFERFEGLANLFVWEHREAIHFLAARLDQEKMLGITELTELTNDKLSPLYKYRSLYPVRREAAAGTAPGLSPRAYWSEVHKCYLDPVPPVRGRQAVRCATGLLG